MVRRPTGDGHVSLNLDKILSCYHVISARRPSLEAKTPQII